MEGHLSVLNRATLQRTQQIPAGDDPRQFELPCLGVVCGHFIYMCIDEGGKVRKYKVARDEPKLELEDEIKCVGEPIALNADHFLTEGEDGASPFVRGS